MYWYTSNTLQPYTSLQPWKTPTEVYWYTSNTLQPYTRQVCSHEKLLLRCTGIPVIPFSPTPDKSAAMKTYWGVLAHQYPSALHLRGWQLFLPSIGGRVCAAPPRWRGSVWGRRASPGWWATWKVGCLAASAGSDVSAHTTTKHISAAKMAPPPPTAIH